MEMNQTQRLPVPRDVAWQALNDPALLKQCIPGCESIEPDGDNAWLLTLTAAVGPVKARFKGRMALLDIQAPESYAIHFDGQGGAAGFGKGVARVALAPAGDETDLSYTVQAQVGGKIAQIGSRLVDAAARKMADTFFARFTVAVTGTGDDSDASAGSDRTTGGDQGGSNGVNNSADPREAQDAQAEQARAPAQQASAEQEQQEGKRKRSWTAWISKS